MKHCNRDTLWCSWWWTNLHVPGQKNSKSRFQWCFRHVAFHNPLETLIQIWSNQFLNSFILVKFSICTLNKSHNGRGLQPCSWRAIGSKPNQGVQGYLLITGRCVGAELEMKSAEQEPSRVGDSCIMKIQWVCNLLSSNYIKIYN